MSSGTGVWQQAVEAEDGLRETAVAVSISERTATAGYLNTEIAALVRQIFSTSTRRTRIFFAAADSETRITDFCERIGRTVAAIPGGRVAVVHGAAFNPRDEETRSKVLSPVPSRTSATHLTENLWRVPFSVFDAEVKNAAAEARALSAFDHVVFGASIGDCSAPLFCQTCDGAVLVIDANHTRREAALRAKEILVQWNVNILGAVLDNRTFPVPEAIYRRL
jgi:hypothetical protein